MKTPGSIAIVGGESLIGRELRELASEAKLASRIKLIGVDETAVTLTEMDGEPAVMTPLDEENLRECGFVVLAGSAASGRKALGMTAGRRGGPILVDLTYLTEEEPSARLRAPMVEPPGFAVPARALHVIAHPAAIALALFLLRLGAEFKLRRASAHIFEPASERGHAGLEELRRQTVNLFSFQPLPKAVFDAQASFAMLARYGDDAPQSLESIELRIERHLATLLAGQGAAPMPSIHLVHAPVFHGYSISAWVEFESRPEESEIAAALNSQEVDVRGQDLEPPNNVDVARQSGIAVGGITPDRNHAGACWFWIVADNLRLMAENALMVVR